jgi:imidazolonepropionase-like amidohydrolase
MSRMRCSLLFALLLIVPLTPSGQTPPSASAQGATILRPARVFDGESVHDGWAVRVRADRIEAAGPAANIDSTGATSIDMPGVTLMPGLVEGHSHVLLHPYNETAWNDQVLHESFGLRVARATNHLRATLMAGFTTIRDLGTEGAGYADVELKQAVEQGIIPGPRMRGRSSRLEVMPLKVLPSSGACHRAPRKPMVNR